MKVKVVLALCFTFLAAFALISVLPTDGEEKIYDNMVRLHVIANSDTAEDQNLKLKVRDAVLKIVDNAERPKSKKEAEDFISNNEDRILHAAAEVISENGYDYPVAIKMGKEDYPERHYDGFVLPAGKYTSLRVVIGTGSGHNWWCVLYPPLCKTAAEDREEVFVAAGFSDEQYRIITENGKGKYKIKFKILEIFEELFGNKTSE